MNTYIYHHNDGDGYAAATIIAMQYCRVVPFDELSGEENMTPVAMDESVHLIPSNFNRDMDFSMIEKGDVIYMLDYTSSRENDIEAINNLWEKFGTDIRYIHIDHHKSALTIIERCPGLRNYLKETDGGGIFPTEEFEQAGCMLAYIAKKIGVSMFSMLFKWYFFKEEIPINIDIKEKFAIIEADAPTWLLYAGDHDIYAGKYIPSHTFAEGAFYEGSYNVYTNLQIPNSFLNLMVIWEEEIKKNAPFNTDSTSPKMEIQTKRLIEYGAQIKLIVGIHYKKHLKHAFEIVVCMDLSKEFLDPTDEMKFPYGLDGKYHATGKLLCMNELGNSEAFLEKFEDYDAVVLFSFDGDLVKYSIFSKKSSEFKCNALAIWGGKMFNISGGGHDHAAGFYNDDLFFKKERVYYLKDDGYKIRSKSDMSVADFNMLFGKEEETDA